MGFVKMGLPWRLFRHPLDQLVGLVLGLDIDLVDGITKAYAWWFVDRHLCPHLVAAAHLPGYPVWVNWPGCGWIPRHGQHVVRSGSVDALKNLNS